LARYENEHEICILAMRGLQPALLGAGMRLPLDGDSVTARILRTGRSARCHVTVGAPIVVEGALWGSWKGRELLPVDAEEGLAEFAELLDTAIANADSGQGPGGPLPAAIAKLDVGGAFHAMERPARA
jgi:hypothetical protein